MAVVVEHTVHASKRTEMEPDVVAFEQRWAAFLAVSVALEKGSTAVEGGDTGASSLLLP